MKRMFFKERDIHELVADYAAALRDGSIPVFFTSLTRREAKKIRASEEFFDDAKIVRILNIIALGEAKVDPDVNLSLFASRVDTKIKARMKRKGVSRAKGSVRSKTKTKIEKTVKKL
jgi:hypothetical protein